MIDLLHERYGTRSQGNGNRYVAMSHVRSDAGFDAERTADFMALDLWPSKGLVLHGHEVKISRSDWLNELKDPEKAGAFIPHVDYWWLVIADKDMVKPGELPAEWGMMALGGDGKLRVVKQAPRLRPLVKQPDSNRYGMMRYAHTPVHRGLAASMLRAACKTAKVATTKSLKREHQDWRDTHEKISETHTVTVTRYVDFHRSEKTEELVTSDKAEAEALCQKYEADRGAWARLESKIVYQYVVES